MVSECVCVCVFFCVCAFVLTFCDLRLCAAGHHLYLTPYLVVATGEDCGMIEGEARIVFVFLIGLRFCVCMRALLTFNLRVRSCAK